jgi:hypothetical protein
MSALTDDQIHALMELRAPFPAEQVGKLPRITCFHCRDNGKGTCDKHPKKTKCSECDAYLSPGHIHLDYVGHAHVTQRLLEVDPGWTWEPVSYDAAGLPLITGGGMWIRLTVCGVTRLGYGDAGHKSGPNAVKEIIGDAIRNAGMRFGVSLELWTKERPDHDDTRKKPATPPQAATEAPAKPEATPKQLETVRAEMDAINSRVSADPHGAAKALDALSINVTRFGCKNAPMGPDDPTTIGQFGSAIRARINTVASQDRAAELVGK